MKLELFGDRLYLRKLFHFSICHISEYTIVFTSEHQATGETLKIAHFQVTVIHKVVFGAIFSTCLVYTKTTHVGDSESGGYCTLPLRCLANT